MSSSKETGMAVTSTCHYRIWNEEHPTQTNGWRLLATRREKIAVCGDEHSTPSLQKSQDGVLNEWIHVKVLCKAPGMTQFNKTKCNCPRTARKEPDGMPADQHISIYVDGKRGGPIFWDHLREKGEKPPRPLSPRHPNTQLLVRPSKHNSRIGRVRGSNPAPADH